MSTNTKNRLTAIRNRSFLNKDFGEFRSQLLDYAQTYFPDRIQDFSEASLGGLFLDMAAYVGDVTSFYLDHQFRELDPETAVERENIERLARNAGVDIRGASPAVSEVTFTLKVASQKVGTIYQPGQFSLPVIKKGTTVSSDSGITFELTEDLDFAERNELNQFLAEVEVNEFNSGGTPKNYFVSRKGTCVSGERATENFTIPDEHIPFRTIVLANSNVSEILDVRDDDGSEYYEVDALTQDTVFTAIPNLDDDNKIVNDMIAIKSAPRRFVKEGSSTTGLTTLRFGSGNPGTLDGDLIPDPSELALPLFGKKTFSKFTIDPNNLLKTRTLGLSPRNTTLQVQYRSGGGLTHNVSARSISSVSGLIMVFEKSPTAAEAQAVRASLFVTNDAEASGGEDPLTIEEIRSLISAAKNSQNRIVSKQDLLSRIYTMPSTFGRVFRAGVSPSPRNPLATSLFIVNRDIDGRLTLSPDALKKNLVTYLNEFRLISDAIDILDSPVVNIGTEFKIAVDPNFSPDAVLRSCIGKIINYTNVENFQIGEPIRQSDLINLVYNTPGVLSVVDLKVVNKTGSEGTRNYSQVIHNITANTRKGLVFPPEGGIFEVKFPSLDIKGAIV